MGIGFRVLGGLGFRVLEFWGLGLGYQGLEFRV